jgi:uncharacterized membrane protein (DUF106 family)
MSIDFSSALIGAVSTVGLGLITNLITPNLQRQIGSFVNRFINSKEKSNQKRIDKLNQEIKEIEGLSKNPVSLYLTGISFIVRITSQIYLFLAFISLKILIFEIKSDLKGFYETASGGMTALLVATSIQISSGFIKEMLKFTALSWKVRNLKSYISETNKEIEQLSRRKS